MADYHNRTNTPLSVSQSPSGSRDEQFDENRSEKTSIFCDTIVLDSPFNENETHFEKACFDTEIVDTDDEQALCELDTEIVPDSEDEGSYRTRIGTLFDSSKITSTSAKNDKQLNPGDHENRRLEYVDSQELEESSEATALCFVDNFLSFNNLDMCHEVQERTRKQSPLVSTAKGTRQLAQIIKRGSPVKGMGTFEWLESCQCHQPNADFFSNINGIHDKGKRSLSNKHQKELAHRHDDIRGPHHSLSSFKDQGSKVSLGTEKESEGNIVNESSKELDELIQIKSSSDMFEASGTTRNIPDMFDVGIGTQIAAEAMEALYYGLPPGCIADDTCEVRENTLTDLQTKSRIHLVRSSPQKVASRELGEVANDSIRRKRSARRYKRGMSSSSWNCNYQELSHRIILKTYKRKQSKKDESVSSNNLKNFETYVSPSISDAQKLLSKHLSEDDSKHRERGVTVKKIKDHVDKPRVMTNNVHEGSMLTYKRKRKRVVSDPPPMLLSGKQNFSKLHSHASADAFGGKLSEQQQSDPEEAVIARLFRLDAWNCPKGKRTHRKVPIHSSAECNMHASFTSAGAEEHNLVSVRSQKVMKDDKTNSSNFNIKRRMHTSLSRPFLEDNSVGSLSRESCYEQVAGVVTISDLAVASITISASDLDTAKGAQTGKLDYVDSTSNINGLNKHKFGESMRKNIEASGTEHNTTLCCDKSVNEASHNNRPYVYQRKLRNKNLPKPSLLKELIGLGVPESISDFTQRGSRTRKELAHIRVLFSQHLDDDVMKQQKKIAARLGISITSYSMDATHFIADTFLRTRNMLEAIALGKPVVTQLWLDSCGQASCLLDEKKYILRDSKREKEIGFSMAVSLARARQYPLLKDKRVCITQNVKPNKEMITSLVKAVGGEVVEETNQRLAAKDQKIPDDLLILSCEQDLAICTPLLEKGAAAHSSELLLNGIVIQKLEYERHQLFPKIVKEKGKSSERNRHSRSSRKH